jgi:hypothetical protein
MGGAILVNGGGRLIAAGDTFSDNTVLGGEGGRPSARVNAASA